MVPKPHRSSLAMSWVNTSPLVKTYTLQEFWELPEPHDHSKLELIAGVLYMTHPPGYTHDNAVSRLIRLLSEFLIKSYDKGTLYVPRAAIWISRNTYLEPDLFYVSEETEPGSNPIIGRPQIWSWRLFHLARQSTTGIRR